MLTGNDKKDEDKSFKKVYRSMVQEGTFMQKLSNSAIDIVGNIKDTGKNLVLGGAKLVNIFGGQIDRDLLNQKLHEIIGKDIHTGIDVKEQERHIANIQREIDELSKSENLDNKKESDREHTYNKIAYVALFNKLEDAIKKIEDKKSQSYLNATNHILQAEYKEELKRAKQGNEPVKPVEVFVKEFLTSEKFNNPVFNTAKKIVIDSISDAKAIVDSLVEIITKENNKDLSEVIDTKDKNQDLENQIMIEKYLKETTGMSAGDNISREDINEYSKLAVAIYKEDFAKIAEDMGYKVIAESNFSLSGLKAAIIEKDGVNALVIEGTNIIKDRKVKVVDDIVADKQIFFKEQPKWQLAALKEFVTNAQHKFKIDQIDIVTGHSLGANLATLWGIENKVPAFAYDAPPDKAIALKMFSEDQINNANVVKVQSDINPINSFGEHIGSIFTVKTGERSYENVNIDIFSNSKNAFALINSDVVSGLKQYISLTGKKVTFGISRESVAKEYGVELDRVIKVSDSNVSLMIKSSTDMHSDSYKEKLVADIHKGQEFIIQPSKQDQLNIEIQSLTMGGIIHVGLDRHSIAKLSEELASGHKIEPHHNNGSIGFVIDKFTNMQDPDCQVFIKQITPAIENHHKERFKNTTHDLAVMYMEGKTLDSTNTTKESLVNQDILQSNPSTKNDKQKDGKLNRDINRHIGETYGEKASLDGKLPVSDMWGVIKPKTGVNSGDADEKVKDKDQKRKIIDLSPDTVFLKKPKITVGYVFNELFGIQSAQAAHPIAIGTGKAFEKASLDGKLPVSDMWGVIKPKTGVNSGDADEKVKDKDQKRKIIDLSPDTVFLKKPKITVGYVFNELFGIQSAQAAHPIAIGTGKALMYGSGMLLGAIAGNKAVEDYKNYQLFSNYSRDYTPYAPEGSYLPALTGNLMLSGANAGLFANPIDQMRFDGTIPEVDTQTTRNNIVVNKGRTMPVMDTETSDLLRNIDANLDRPNITDFSTNYRPRSILFTPDQSDKLAELSRLPGFTPSTLQELQERFPSDERERLAELSKLPGFAPSGIEIWQESFPDQRKLIEEFDMSILQKKIELDYDKLSKEHFDDDVRYIHGKKYEGAKITDIDSDVVERMSGLIITDKSGKIRGVHNTQDHHIIHQATDGAKELFDELGLDIHGPENRITLPSDIKLSEHEITNMTQHVGKHSGKIVKEIKKEVEDIRTALREGSISKERAKEKLLETIHEHRQGLETGKNPLNSVGRKY